MCVCVCACVALLLVVQSVLIVKVELSSRNPKDHTDRMHASRFESDVTRAEIRNQWFNMLRFTEYQTRPSCLCCCPVSFQNALFRFVATRCSCPDALFSVMWLDLKIRQTHFREIIIIWFFRQQQLQFQCFFNHLFVLSWSSSIHGLVYYHFGQQLHRQEPFSTTYFGLGQAMGPRDCPSSGITGYLNRHGL